VNFSPQARKPRYAVKFTENVFTGEMPAHWLWCNKLNLNGRFTNSTKPPQNLLL